MRSTFRRTTTAPALCAALLLLITVKGQAQEQDKNLKDLEYTATSEFQPTIKDAVKLNELPEINDSTKRIQDIKYGIHSTPVYSKYEVSPITAAKMQNEPLSRLYHSLLKLGMGTYTTPYAELFINNLRSRDMAYGLHFKSFSSFAQLKDVGYSSFSDNEGELYGKKFYKRHTLTGEFNYKSNMVHYYGYDTSLNHINDKNYTRQRYQLFEPKLTLQSHFTDSSSINHLVKLGYYNLTDLYKASENNIRLNADLNTFINKERLYVNLLGDFYNNKLPNDTFNDMILTINPYFAAGGEKWHADIGIRGTIDIFDKVSKFYFYPQLNVYYDVYNNYLIPYAGINGNLQKNSMRSLSTENPFIRTDLPYQNSNYKINLFGGVRGNLSSNTSYDAKVQYSRVDHMHYYVIDYTGDLTQMNNRFTVLYANTNFLNVSGQLDYQLKEKIHFSAKGNYYLYAVDSLSKPYQKPDFDLTFSAIYNLKSKLILRADVFVIGKQWARQQVGSNGAYAYQDVQLKGIADLNLGAEYRYSKMLSFFAKVNNIANYRYYRWDRYPTQRFNLMIGLTFVPF